MSQLQSNFLRVSENSSEVLSELQAATRKRKSYSREDKLKVFTFYHSNEKNMYQTTKRFGLNSRTVMRWVRNKKNIRESQKGRKRVAFTRSALFPDMEQKLYDEYKNLRKRGLKVKYFNHSFLFINYRLPTAR